MASRGPLDDDDTSISVLSEHTTSAQNSDPGTDNIPEFHMYTGSYESDASHYALSLSHRVLQKKNRDLEQQLLRLQRENSKLVKSKGRKASTTSTTQLEGENESLSPTMYRSRNVVVEPQSGETKAMEDFIAHLQAKLEKSESEKHELIHQRDDARARCQQCEQRRRDVSMELDQALQIAASRLEELEATRQDLDYERARIEKLQASFSSTDALQRRLKDAEAKLKQAQHEYATVQQLYQESAIKEDKVQRTLKETLTQIRDVKGELSNKDTTIDRQKNAIRDFHAARERLEEMNKTLRAELDRRTAHPGEEENDSFLLEETREVIVELQKRILGMQDVIQKQNVMIKDLVQRVQQRAQASSPSLRSVSPSAGMAPRLPVTTAMVVEDLSFEEPRTMTGAPESEDQDQTPLMRVNLPQNPQINRPPRPSREPPASQPQARHSSPLSGIVTNGVQQPLFNFSTLAAVGTTRGNVTEPIVRHPPPIDGQRPVTVPITPTSRQNAIGNVITVETNGVLDNNNLYTRTRMPVEQSDHVMDTRATPPKECPICNRKFPKLSQEAFELHVNQCLTKAESSPTPATVTPSPTRESPQDILECPVCNQIYAPGTPHDEFQNHVQSHFVEENFEMLSKQQHH